MQRRQSGRCGPETQGHSAPHLPRSFPRRHAEVGLGPQDTSLRKAHQLFVADQAEDLEAGGVRGPGLQFGTPAAVPTRA